MSLLAKPRAVKNLCIPWQIPSTVPTPAPVPLSWLFPKILQLTTLLPRQLLTPVNKFMKMS